MLSKGWKGSFRRVARRAALLGAILAPVTFLGLWLAFQHKPAWYQPVRLDEQGYQLARRDAVATADSISDQLVQGKEFELILTDRSVNEWLAALPRIWPEAKRTLPDELRDPAVRFAEDRIRFAAHFDKNGWQAIVSVDLFVRVSDDGTSVTIALAGARGGSLPVPRAVIERLLRPLIEHARSNGMNHDTDATSPWDAAVKSVRSVDQLFTGVTTRNRFVWPNGKRPFRIESIRATNGELHIRLHPL
ncbi:MAG: hypothetical protein AAB385_08530 [Planctomycetota bacterium]